MLATDMTPDRIGVAKQIAKDFVDALPYESYIGVISFSGESYIEQSLVKN